MGKDRVIDYFQIMRDYDKTQGKKPDGFDIPLRSVETPEGEVDYLKVSREYVNYLEKDRSKVIHIDQ